MADSAMVPAIKYAVFASCSSGREAVELCVQRSTGPRRLLPSEHRFELGREMRRSSISVPSNVAEGFSRHSRKAYRAHVAIALGSEAELATQIEIARRLAILPDSTS